jgi:hypothetical protein
MSPREHISVAALYASVGLYCRSDMRARMSASSWTSRAYTRVLRMVTAVYAFGGPYWGTTRWHALIPAHEGMHAGSDACTLLSDMNSSHAFVCLRRCAFLRLRALASRRQTPSPAPRSSRSQRRRCAASVAEGPGIDAMKGRREEMGSVYVCVGAWVWGGDWRAKDGREWRKRSWDVKDATPCRTQHAGRIPFPSRQPFPPIAATPARRNALSRSLTKATARFLPRCQPATPPPSLIFSGG